MDYFKKTDFNKDWLIRYHSAGNSESVLISFDKFKNICGNLFVYARIINRLKKTKKESVTVKLRRGCRFVFIYR